MTETITTYDIGNNILKTIMQAMPTGIISFAQINNDTSNEKNEFADNIGKIKSSLLRSIVKGR